MRRLKLWLLGALMVSAVAATGCLRTAQVYTIYPDGSGKAEVKITLMGMMAQAAKMGAGQPGAENPLDQIKNSLQGKVYWKDLKAEDGADGMSYIMSGTAYFEDINEVQPENGSLSFAKEGDGYKLILEMQQEMPMGMPGGEGGDMSPEEKAQADQMKAMMKGMLAGFEMKVSCRMPGAVSSIEGFDAHDGRTASMTIDEAAVNKMMDAGAKPPERMIAVSGAQADGVDAEWTAFKAELAAAKAAAQAEGGDEGGKDDDSQF